METQRQTYKRSLSGSVGAGMGSLFNAKGRTYYVLEHKVSSKYHKAGEAQEIIVDQVELGRDSTCAVRFDESFKTVSRKHAAIVRDGQNWKLVQLSKTNTTFLNGHPVQNEWYLQNGDEIQLAVNGPKLGFILPQGNKSTVASIGLSRRLSLFRQQALRPYKTAMWAMAAVILLLIVGGTFFGIKGKEIIDDQGETIVAMQQALDRANEEYAQYRAEQEEKQKQTDRDLARANKTIKDLNKKIANIETNGEINPSVTRKITKECEKDIYFVVMSLHLEYGSESQVLKSIGTGTGFLLNDGRFVTARHCVEPWMFINSAEDELFIVNLMQHNGGRVTCILDAYSPTGKHLTLRSNDFNIDKTTDMGGTNDAGYAYRIARIDGTDWAVAHTSERGELVASSEMSRNLQAQDKLTILGYPMGLGVESQSNIHPLYSEAIVAADGLNKDNVITTTATTFEHGNSGGPVFKIENGKMIVIGLVSAGAGRSTGFVIPISNVR